jgi:plasmid stabilization system protein ParE
VGADQDLDEIWRYIARDGIEAADRWIDTVYETFDFISRTRAADINAPI